jgi:uncharacterized membrane protein YgaE (UPF0421/DUF939 family)
MDSYKKVIELVLGSAIVAVVALWAIAFFYNNSENKLYIEYLKLTYQFFLLVVIGAAVTLLFSEYTRAKQRRDEDKSREREHNAAKKEIYRKFLIDYESAYNSAKRIRRLLRAGSRLIQSNESNFPEKKSIPEKIMIDKNAYQEQMKALINVQLDFEYLEKLAGTDFFLGVPEQKSLISNLDSIEKYLNKLVDEYEHCYEIFSGKSSIPITQLPKLEEFIRSYKLACNFREMFKYPDKEIQSILINLLLKNE